MESTNIVKMTAAFVAGVVVALGSALIIAHVSEMRRPAPVVQASEISSAPAELPDAGTDTATQQPLPAPKDVRPEPKPSAPTHVKVPVPIRTIAERRRPQLAFVRSKPTAEPLQIPQAELPPASQAPASAATATEPTPVQTAPAATHDPEPDPKDGLYTPTAMPPTPAAPPQPHVVTLPVGTVFSIRLGETLSTDHNYTGDTFRATLLSPIIMDGFIIADRGSKVLGKVVNAQSAGHMTNVAGLNLALTEINTTDGQRIHIDTSLYERRGSSSTGQDVAKIAGGAALGAIIGGAAGGGKGAAIGAGAGGAAGTGAVLLSHGKPAVVESETQMSFRLATPVTITEKLN